MVPLERSWRGFQTFLSRCIFIESMVLVLTKINKDTKGNLTCFALAITSSYNLMFH